MHFTIGQWFIIVSASFSLVAYAHGNFVTIREKQDIKTQLERIELKVDDINKYLRKTD